MVHAHKNERGQIVRKATERITLVRHSSAFVFRHIVLGVVHAYVVGVVRLGGLPEERPYDPGEVKVEEAILLLEPRAVAGAVHHKAVGTFERYIIEELVENSGSPPDSAGYTGPIKQHRQWYECKSNFKRKIDKGKVALITDERDEKTV